jgi:hypothetical protein
MTAVTAAVIIHAAVAALGRASATITPAHNGANSLRNGISLKSTVHSIRLFKDKK